MDYQNQVSTLFRLFAFVCLVSCNSRYAETNECTIEEHFGHYRIKSDKISIKGLQRIDLSKVWDKADDFEYEYLGINYRDTGYVYFDIVNNGDKLIRAEEQVIYYVSIWSDINDDVIQYITLDDLSYTYSSPLIIENGIIEFPPSYQADDADMIRFFNTITKKQIIQAVNNYYLSAELDCEETKKLAKEKRTYLRYANQFKQNESLNNSNGTFCILDGVHKVVCTYRGNEGEYSKSIYYSEIHGN